VTSAPPAQGAPLAQLCEQPGQFSADLVLPVTTHDTVNALVTNAPPASETLSTVRTYGTLGSTPTSASGEEPYGEKEGAVKRQTSISETPRVCVAPATSADGVYLLNAFEQALSPYYDGDHLVHAQRVLHTHLSGGIDNRGLLSARQLLLVLWEGGARRGIINLVFKRQSTCKISPLILFPAEQNGRGLGAILIHKAEEIARDAGARNLYCTVAASNERSLSFFLQNGFFVCGDANEQYKAGETEILLRKPLSQTSSDPGAEEVISVVKVQEYAAWNEVKELLSSSLPRLVDGAGDAWLESMYRNAKDYCYSPRDDGRRSWVYAAQDRSGCYRAGAIVTYKKGGALKVMPISASDISAFRALVIDLPTLLFESGRKVYIHHVPTAAEVAALQESDWKLEGLLPGAYREDVITQQWGCSLDKDSMIRSLRIQSRYLSMIRSGRKKIEVRVAYDHIKTIRSGDVIKLVAGIEKVVRQVREVRHYTSIDELLEHEDVAEVLPGLKRDEALQRLREIYPPEKERLGIIVFDLG
jgi:ASC-1-like (ASCH) protein